MPLLIKAFPSSECRLNHFSVDSQSSRNVSRTLMYERKHPLNIVRFKGNIQWKSAIGFP